MSRKKEPKSSPLGHSATRPLGYSATRLLGYSPPALSKTSFWASTDALKIKTTHQSLEHCSGLSISVSTHEEKSKITAYRHYVTLNEGNKSFTELQVHNWFRMKTRKKRFNVIYHNIINFWRKSEFIIKTFIKYKNILRYFYGQQYLFREKQISESFALVKLSLRKTFTSMHIAEIRLLKKFRA